jgi:signal transduction histidine kinase
VHRTLRFQLIAIVVFTVVVVLTASQWVSVHLSERAMEHDVKQRALLELRAIGSMWEHTETRGLRDELQAIVDGDREITAIEIFRFRNQAAEIEVSAREVGAASTPTLAAAQVAQLLENQSLTESLPDTGGVERVRITVPLQRDGAVVGAAQLELGSGEVARLERRMRVIHGVMLLTSLVLISFILTLFLERRVGHPVNMLVNVMRQVEHGELGVRVDVGVQGEFAFLARSLNRMLARIEDLTAGLEEQVQAATRDLAAKNQELQVVNARLWRAQQEISQGDRLATLGQMAGTLAHELGTPLNSVLGFVQLMMSETASPWQRDKLAIVESQVRRMIDTIRSVLERTRDAPVRRAPVALNPLATEAVALVSAQLAARHLAAHVDVPVDLPAVAGDAIGLRQVLLNLLTNAVDAMDGPGTITVRATVMPRNGGRAPQIELSVHDAGRGMSAEERQRALEPFYTTKAVGRGTGLGLAIVDHIVHAHGGQLLVESTPGAGTTVRVRLPVEG